MLILKGLIFCASPLNFPSCLLTSFIFINILGSRGLCTPRESGKLRIMGRRGVKSGASHPSDGTGPNLGKISRKAAIVACASNPERPSGHESCPATFTGPLISKCCGKGSRSGRASSREMAKSRRACRGRYRPLHPHDSDLCS